MEIAPLFYIGRRRLGGAGRTLHRDIKAVVLHLRVYFGSRSFQ